MEICCFVRHSRVYRLTCWQPFGVRYANDLYLGGTDKLGGQPVKLYWQFDPQKPTEYASIRAVGYPAQYEGAATVNFAYHVIISIGNEKADPSYGSANINPAQWSFDPVYDGTAPIPGLNRNFPVSEGYKTRYKDWVKARAFYINAVY